MTNKYCIRVSGMVDQAWSDYFGDMAITIDREHDEDTAVTSSLAGPVADQAALLGILYRLYSLGYELISVERVVAFLALFGLAALMSQAYAGCC